MSAAKPNIVRRTVSKDLLTELGGWSLEPIFNPEVPYKYVEDLTRRAKQLEDEVRETEIDVTSKDELVTVTVTIPGKVTGLRLNASALHGRGAKELAESILSTVQKAQEIGERAGADLVNRYLPGLPNLRDLSVHVAPRMRRDDNRQ